jgi:hypothetical protein
MRRVTLRPCTLFLASAALLALPAASAVAGQCTSEIETMSKIMAAHDAGTGPTAGAPGTASTTTGQHPPTAAMSEADTSTRASRAAERSDSLQHPPTAAMNRETTGSSSPTKSRETDGSAMPTYEATPSQEEHPPTAAMNRATTGAASPQDVQRQTQGEPTAAEQATGKQQIDSAHLLARAMNALEQARALDRQGNEAECLRSLGEAKLMLGTR